MLFPSVHYLFHFIPESAIIASMSLNAASTSAAVSVFGGGASLASVFSFDDLRDFVVEVEVDDDGAGFGGFTADVLM